jgi:hypothetical protein
MLISYFKRERKINAFNISISRIEKNDQNAFTYQFRIFFSPVFNAQKIKDQIHGIGYEYYSIRISTAFKKRFFLSNVAFVGLEI